MPNKKQIRRSIVIFDASNFYFKLKTLDIAHKSQFDYLKFSQWLTKDTKLTKKFYQLANIVPNQQILYQFVKPWPNNKNCSASSVKRASLFNLDIS